MKTDLVIREINEEGLCILYVLDRRRNPLMAKLYPKNKWDTILEDTLKFRKQYNVSQVNWYPIDRVNVGFFINNKHANRKLDKHNAII